VGLQYNRTYDNRAQRQRVHVATCAECSTRTTATDEGEKMRNLRELTFNSRIQAVDYLAAAARIARTEDEMRDQMIVAQIFTSHVLATLLFNSVQQGAQMNAQLDKMVEGIRREYMFLRDAAESGGMQNMRAGPKLASVPATDKGEK
jgi:hypothetical protein